MSFLAWDRRGPRKQQTLNQIFLLLTPTARGPSVYVRVWRLLYRIQILTYKDGPRTERIKK